jgi:hypothetical protein
MSAYAAFPYIELLFAETGELHLLLKEYPKNEDRDYRKE